MDLACVGITYTNMSFIDIVRPRKDRHTCNFLARTQGVSFSRVSAGNGHRHVWLKPFEKGWEMKERKMKENERN